MGIQTSKGPEISSVTLGRHLQACQQVVSRNHRENIETVPS